MRVMYGNRNNYRGLRIEINCDEVLIVNDKRIVDGVYHPMNKIIIILV